MSDFRIVLVVALILSACTTGSKTNESDEEQIRSIHTEIINAHVNGDVGAWMEVESDHVVSVNGGRVSFPQSEQRRDQRAAYLRDATFSIYKDLREPIVRISDDGSIAWLIAEVEVKGTKPDSDGEMTSFHDVWAWIALYEKANGRWRVVGNASNKR